jgi:hypothetical protein
MSLLGSEMKIDLRPNLDQIRFIATSALHAWDYQSLQDGREQVIADMRALLDYLSAFDNAEGVAVAAVFRIEAGVRIERSTREGDIFDLAHRYISQNTSARIYSSDGDHCASVAAEQGVRVDDLPRTVDQPVDFCARPDGGAKR